MSAPHALVVGTTSWGCTLAMQFARAGARVTVACRTPEEAERLSAEREERRLLPGIALPDSLVFQADGTGIGPLDAVVFAVPSQSLRENLQRVLPGLSRPLPPLVSACKGLEAGSELRMSQVLAESARAIGEEPPVAVISGPNIAREVALGLPVATVVASSDPRVSETVREMLMTEMFRVYTSSDVVGVELGGALKNVITIGVGIGDGLNTGENGRAAFLTRGLAEMTRLGVSQGAAPLTFTGLAGLGDLIVTSVSRRSRNRHVGEELAKGRRLDEILADMVHVAEGVETTRPARALARRAGVDMPIVEATHRVLFEGERPTDAIRALMTRAAQYELAGLPRVDPGTAGEGGSAVAGDGRRRVD